MSPDKPYNPLDKKNLAESVVRALLAEPVSILPPAAPFEGAGLYVIYYTGDFPAYRPIADANGDGGFRQPIYAGKADPPGKRKGASGLETPPGSVLYRRLVEHAATIEQAGDLSLDDFRCRHLVADDIWIPLGEALLIQTYRPLWNLVIDGFGNHDPGGGRYKGKRPPWDVVHPGRAWAMKCAPNPRTREDLLDAAARFLSGEPA